MFNRRKVRNGKIRLVGLCTSARSVLIGPRLDWDPKNSPMVGGTRSPRDWLLIRPRREEPVIKAHNKHVQHGCYDVHQRRGSGAYAAKTPSSNRRVADASRAVPGRRDFGLEDVNGKSRGRSSGAPWGFERRSRGAGSGHPTAREASSRPPNRPVSFHTSS